MEIDSYSEDTRLCCHCDDELIGGFYNYNDSYYCKECWEIAKKTLNLGYFEKVKNSV